MELRLAFKGLEKIESVVFRAVESVLNEILNKVAADLKTLIPNEIEKRILTSPGYQSLLSGRFRGEMGVVNAAPVAKGIIDILRKDMIVKVRPVKVGKVSVTGGMTVSVLRADFSPLFSLPGASFISEKAGVRVPWLEWLLTAGENIMVANYHFSGVILRGGKSRTGEGLMYKGGSWHVPGAIAGTKDNNWLTRALTGLEGVVDAALRARL